MSNIASNQPLVRRRAAWAGSGDVADEKIWFDLLEKFGPTEFLGYSSEGDEGLKTEGTVLAIIKDGKLVKELHQGEQGSVITNQTTFYAESGGQVGDTGWIYHLDEDNLAAFEVHFTKKKLGKLHAHEGVQKKRKPLEVGQAVKMSVNEGRRSAIRQNHSVTHLMHEALRRVLGEHVTQKGSLQDANRTRFDISHPKGVSKDEIARVEELVMAEIAAATPVETRLMGIDEARATGAMALFGEKYDDEVRVVAMGRDEGNRQFSIELCGGTHVKNTSEIGKFKIISESALSAGVRRVEAVTGERVDQYLEHQKREKDENTIRLSLENTKLRAELAELGGTPAQDVPAGDAELEKDNKRLQRQISDLRRAQGAETSDDEIKEIGGVKFIGKTLEGFPPKDLKPMADDLKKQLGSGVIALVATNDGKASIVVAVTEDLTSKLNAVDLVKIGSEALGGKGGGGRPDMAQAGGPNADGADMAVKAIEAALAG